jgi:carbamoyltransferase
MNHIEATYNDVVDLLVKKNIVCIHQGRTEAGPRALGNRSVLYDPRDSGAQRKVNSAKGRQWWRPFAASVLEEHAPDWFEMLTLKSSPYMMYAIPVKEDKREMIPGVIHADGTCRIQTVTEEQNYHYYHLIKTFYEETGIPMLFNTSLNLAGEVISHSIYDTYDMLYKCPIEYVYEPEENKIVSFPNLTNVAGQTCLS